MPIVFLFKPGVQKSILRRRYADSIYGYQKRHDSNLGLPGETVSGHRTVGTTDGGDEA